MVNLIKHVIESYFNLPAGSICIRSRKREIVQARQIAAYFIKEETTMPLYLIGEAVGGIKHATVLYCIKTVKDLYEIDNEFREYVDDISRKISGADISIDEKKDAIILGLITILKRK